MSDQNATTENAYHDVLLTITKASLQPDGSVRWQAVASDTGKDKAGEATSVDLFQDWIDRVTYKASVGYLPEPKLPFLGVSHYPALDGFGEAGTTRRMYIDGSTFKADGVFKPDNPIGQKLLGAVKAELSLIKKGGEVEKPIRISAGWWDIEHYHDDSNYMFTRQSLTDKCPLCDKGQTNDKIYKAGQLDHFAATRVPMNPRTSLGLEVKSMAKVTRREDAESIIGPEDALEIERRARLVGKSDTEELPQAMVTKAATKIGSFIKRKREEMDMSIVDLAAKTPVTDGTIGDIESGVIGTPAKPVIAAIAKALKVSEKQLDDMLPSNAEPADKVAKAETTKADDMLPGEFLKNIRRKKKEALIDIEEKMGFKKGRLKRIEDDEDEIDFETMADVAEAIGMDDEELEDMGQRFGKKRKADTEDDEDTQTPAKGSKKEQLLARFGKKRRKTPPAHKADVDYDDEFAEGTDTPVERMGYGHDEDDYQESMIAPLGGAVTIGEAEGFIAAKQKMGQLYSYWDIFQTVTGNIMMADEETVPNKVAAMGQAVKDLGSKIDTLKAGLSDAFLIQESAAAYDDADEYIDEDYDDEVIIMENQNTPESTLADARKAAFENKAFTREQREAAIQEAFNTYAQTVEGQLQEADPLPQAEQIAGAIKGALADVLGPFTEQLGLVVAKMNAQPVQPQPQAQQDFQQVHFPQQKSMAPFQTTPQPVLADGNGQGHAVSPVLGKPSPLTDQIRKSVGLHS